MKTIQTLSFILVTLFLLSSCSDIMPKQKTVLLKAEAEKIIEKGTPKIQIKNIGGRQWTKPKIWVNKYYFFQIPEHVLSQETIYIDYSFFKDEKGKSLPLDADIFRIQIETEDGYWGY